MARDNPHPKPHACVLRRTPPIGTPKLCRGCCDFIDECVKLPRTVRTRPPPKVKRETVEGAKTCGICGRSLARPSTPMHSFKGMLAVHLKWKHPEEYDAYQSGQFTLDQLIG